MATGMVKKLTTVVKTSTRTAVGSCPPYRRAMMIGKTAAGIAAWTAITSRSVVVIGTQCTTASIIAGSSASRSTTAPDRRFPVSQRPGLAQQVEKRRPGQQNPQRKRAGPEHAKKPKQPRRVVRIEPKKVQPDAEDDRPDHRVEHLPQPLPPVAAQHHHARRPDRQLQAKRVHKNHSLPRVCPA